MHVMSQESFIKAVPAHIFETLKQNPCSGFIYRQFSICLFCVKTSASSINPPPPTHGPCPAGYISWYKNCYKVVEEVANWDSAQKACVQQGGNLASIDMSYDQAFVAGVVLQGSADAWIGLRRQVLSGAEILKSVFSYEVLGLFPIQICFFL